MRRPHFQAGSLLIQIADVRGIRAEGVGQERADGLQFGQRLELEFQCRIIVGALNAVLEQANGPGGPIAGHERAGAVEQKSRLLPG